MVEFLQQVINGVVIGGTYALLTIGLTMIFGLMRVLNYAHGEFYMIGGILACYIIDTLQISFFLSIPITLVCCFLIGMFIERLLIKKLYGKPVVTTAIVTTGLSIFLQNTVFLMWGNMPRSISTPFPLTPIQVGPLTIAPIRMFVLIVVAVVIIFTELIIKYTRLGLAMRATFQDSTTASMYGIKTKHIFSFTFAYGCVLAGLAGVLCGGFLTVTPFMGSSVTNKAWAIAIVGGTGNIPGAILGGFLLGIVETLGAGYLSASYKDAFSFIIVILVMIFRPNGLFVRKEKT